MLGCLCLFTHCIGFINLSTHCIYFHMQLLSSLVSPTLYLPYIGGGGGGGGEKGKGLVALVSTTCANDITGLLRHH